MSSNGRLSSRELAPIAGGGQLQKDAAKAWNAFAKYCKTQGITVEISDSYRPLGKPGDLRRGVWSQWAAWERYQQGGNLAANPGTSNHGLGLAVDVPPGTQDAIRKYGSIFGWSKIWSDAPSENWHFKWSKQHAVQRVIDKYSSVGINDVMHPGDNGPGVVKMKQLLKANGFWPAIYPINGGWGRLTTVQVKKFQKARGLKADGIVGPGTWKQLFLVKKRKSLPKQPVKPAIIAGRHFADIYSGDTKFDAKKYKADKLTADLIVLKATEGKTYKDPGYAERVKQAREAGLTVFSYHFARPSSNKPEDEARNFAGYIKTVGMRTNERLVLDWEDPKFENKDGQAWVDKFIKEMKVYGYDVRILYSGGWYLPGTLKAWPKDATGKALKYWHAAYTSTPESNVPAIAKPNLWAVQYTDGQTGKEPRSVNGIGHCDLSYLV